LGNQGGGALLVILLLSLVGGATAFSSNQPQPETPVLTVIQQPQNPTTTPTLTPKPTLTVIHPVETSKLNQTGNPAMSTPINKVTKAYGDGVWTSAAITYTATHFDMLIANFQGSEGTNPLNTYFQNIKTENPTIKIYGYKDLVGMQTTYDDWATVNANESWFIHDSSGNRCRNNLWGFYLMDPASAGWRQHFKDYVNAKFASYGAYDGVYCDDVWDTLYSPSTAYDHVVPASVAASWHSDVLGMLTYLKSNITAGKLVLINTEQGWMYGHVNFEYVGAGAADGMEIEGFIHAIDQAVGNYNFAASVLDCVVMVSGTLGKICIADSGCLTAKASVIKMCYAAFLMGLNGSGAHWGWNTGNMYTLAGSYQEIADSDLGSPTAAYYQTQSVYRRDFAKGAALLNPTGASRYVTLGATYKLADHSSVSALTLDAYSGEILYAIPDAPSEPPPPEYYYISTVAGDGTSVSPNRTNFPVLVGQNFSATASTLSDWAFLNWTRNGTVVGATQTYTLTDGIKDASYTLIANATYSPPVTPTFTVQVSAITGGSCNPTGTQTSNVGTPLNVTATPAGGSTFSHWHLDGADYGNTNPVAISGYAYQTLTLQAQFDVAVPPPPAPTTYTVNVETSTGGTTNYTGLQAPITVGTAFAVTASPSKNYTWDYWVVDGVASYTAATKTLSGTAGATYNLKPVFRYIPPTITPVTLGGTVVEGSGYFNELMASLETVILPTVEDDIFPALEKVLL
jgi:hypothetical protein